MGNTDMLLPVHWERPDNVGVIISSRCGGISNAPFGSLNLADHVGDDAKSVLQSRKLRAGRFSKISWWQWLDQVHGTEVAVSLPSAQVPQADALYTRQPGIACCVLTADCLPVLLTNHAGDEIGVAHAGWRGLAAGVIESCVSKFTSTPQDLLAYLGPAIGPCHFEVGEDVYAAFQNQLSLRQMESCFQSLEADGKFLANLYALAEARLQALGVRSITTDERCTVCNPDTLYSFRRDGETGRMVNAIYLKS